MQLTRVPQLPAPYKRGSFDVESFTEYRRRWPKQYDCVPDLVIETWIYRHWRNFQARLSLRPLEWDYELGFLDDEKVMTLAHVGDWMETLPYWGVDLLDRKTRKGTWLGRYILEQGTTSTPTIVAANAGAWSHIRGNRAALGCITRSSPSAGVIL